MAIPYSNMCYYVLLSAPEKVGQDKCCAMIICFERTVYLEYFKMPHHLAITCQKTGSFENIVMKLNFKHTYQHETNFTTLCNTFVCSQSTNQHKKYKNCLAFHFTFENYFLKIFPIICCKSKVNNVAIRFVT